MSREVHALNAAWGWTGVEFAEKVAHSLMGHMLVTDRKGAFHYVDPDLGAVTALGNEKAAAAHMAKQETQVVWRADALVDAAVARLGPPALGEVYSLTLPALLRGDYAHENLIRIDLVELIHLSGDLARQTHDLPDGAVVKLKVED
ncbi:T6SS immunity protein Tdi1 domain-containing protein [Novosphingobium sp. BL-52-GroH]|uniref:T6SS immunity protein Tdi1 domain-containing protein n=1 Tax=Novosphingobium sp. BL-52-GroH TaxID=3349877 RepID=UPI00384E143B